MFTRHILILGCFFSCSLGTVRSAVADEYDPLTTASDFTAETLKLDVIDSNRDRTIPILVYLPESRSSEPVVLFSHGLGGSREASPYLGKHWAARGYVAVFLQHPGSDSSVWEDKPIGSRMQAMEAAASGKNMIDRVRDVPAVLDQLQRWNDEASHPLHGRLELDVVGMSGHSFGALTTQSVSGQSAGRFGQRATDSRIKAAILMSPSKPRLGNAKTAFADVSIPWLLMTGTHDVGAIGGQTAESRRGVYPALPAGDKYELVLHNAEHSAFSDRGLPNDRLSRNPNHHVVILALSTAFWDAYLRNDNAAKTWLQGAPAKAILEPLDEWQAK
ncbi:alpha/beta hydrolase family protein [Aporhodopirellula aestuarii]|uniref:Dienelactone hydrolase n=1 Tax=Aporhodopirellula aestuarii TaxID=2950107 RepID=A0ABT0UCV1_9BACT|nr:dienelactone hydrolase [Aporhodopirellula aestuarii]MCM2374600.1 dienelactone hydrolase [Aporhodopirellula aestuarii]